MEEALEFPVLLRLIDERSIAFRAAVMSAPGLELKVPTCPEWTLLDLAQHLGAVHRNWAAIVSAGPGAAPPAESEPEVAGTAPREREPLLAWSAASTRLLLDALREAGPDRGCWTWWGRSQSPQTSGAVARHQLQEVTVHTYDAQITLGAPRPLPDTAALDGVEEFLSTCCAWTAPWPHEDAALDFHAAEGRSWRLTLSADGARTARLPAPGTMPAADLDVAYASARGTAAELVLAFYDRIPLDSLQLDGDLRLFDLLRDWDQE
ncbi:maleylpyruvate isomerase family mycothiol-dependent enzyme [Trebonia sp.]|uniref:maleylpyruvate isomerase family mycothiol-dependent enzyme n=1 Tax=Trebonia sp. TaxID=2767075 RepID=UPI00260225F7|nr:maleylpyruvate isomerase family mycothiol-dependent enzyme [Trebonia sp.]